MADMSDMNKAQVQRYISYFKAKRERLLSDREVEKDEFINDRLADDQAIFSKADVQDMLDTYHAQVIGTIREALEGFVNLSAVYTSQVLQRAEMSGVQIDADLSAIEDQYSLDQIQAMALQGHAPGNLRSRGSALPSLGAAPPVSPSGLAPPTDLATAARLQELEQENMQMRERYNAMQMQVSQLAAERSQLASQLEQAGFQAQVSEQALTEHLGASTQFKELKAIVRKKTDEVKMLREYINMAGLALPGTEGGVEIAAEDD